MRSAFGVEHTEVSKNQLTPAMNFIARQEQKLDGYARRGLAGVPKGEQPVKIKLKRNRAQRVVSRIQEDSRRRTYEGKKLP